MRHPILSLFSLTTTRSSSSKPRIRSLPNYYHSLQQTKANMANTLPQLDIHVSGEAALTLPPERAELSFDVSVRSLTSAADATAPVVASARLVENLLRAHTKSGSLDYWSRTSLSSTSVELYSTQGLPHPPTEFKASVSFDLHVTKFSRLGQLIGELTAIEHVVLDEVKWTLTPATQNAHCGALRASAARNAREKAEQYAQALGYGQVWAVEAREMGNYTRAANRKGGGGMPRNENVQSVGKNRVDVEGEEGWEDASEEVS